MQYSQVTEGRLIQVEADSQEEATKLIEAKLKEFKSDTNAEAKILKTPNKK
jgi:hypothetical protein